MSTLNLTDAVADALDKGDVERLRELWAETEAFLSGDVQTWTPVLSAATTPPTLGTGSTQSGSYRVMLGTLVMMQFLIVFGSSGTAAGSGNYHIELPFKISANGQAVSTVGHGRVYDSSGTASYLINIETASGLADNQVRMVYDSQAASSVLNQALPFAWGANDELQGQLLFIAKDLVI